MTISTTTRKAGPFTGNGVTVAFSFAFKVFQKSDIAVVKLDALGAQTTLTLDSHYSVTLNADQDIAPGGTVTYPISGAPLPATEQLVIASAITETQLKDITNGGGFFPRANEDSFDKLTALVQQLREVLNRTPSAPITDPVGLTYAFPSVAARASRMLAFDSNGNVVPSAQVTGTAASVLSDLISSNIALGDALVRFRGEAGTAVDRTVHDKLIERVSVFDFMTTAQIADVRATTKTLDVSVPFQNAINFCATNNRVLFVPTGHYRLDSQININAGPVTVEGEQRDRTRLFARANAPCFNVTSIQFTLKNVTIEGEQNGAKTLQVGVYVNNVNQFVAKDCTFTRLYNSIQLHEVSFYCEILDCIFGDNIFAHLKTTGTAAAGNEFTMRGCQIIPATAQFGLHIENAGSMILTDCRFSPANMTGECLKFVSRATFAGVHKFVNTLFEGSGNNFGSVRLEGSGVSPINYVFFVNCYFNQNGTGDCVTLLNTQYVTFTSCYFSGTNRALNINTGTNRGIKLVNCDFQLATLQPVILGTTPTKVLGLHVTNPTWTGSTRFIDLSSLAAADVDGVDVIGGDVGTHGDPILVPSAAAVRVRRVGTKGVNKFEAGGITTFSGTGAVSLFAIPHGLAATPTQFYAVPNSPDAGNAEIREVTVNGTNVNVQCKASAIAGTNNVSWSWWARC